MISTLDSYKIGTLASYFQEFKSMGHLVIGLLQVFKQTEPVEAGES
jgi:hypothetical protein